MVNKDKLKKRTYRRGSREQSVGRDKNAGSHRRESKEDDKKQSKDRKLEISSKSKQNKSKERQEIKVSRSADKKGSEKKGRGETSITKDRSKTSQQDTKGYEDKRSAKSEEAKLKIREMEIDVALSNLPHSKHEEKRRTVLEENKWKTERERELERAREVERDERRSKDMQKRVKDREEDLKVKLDKRRREEKQMNEIKRSDTRRSDGS